MEKSWENKWNYKDFFKFLLKNPINSKNVLFEKDDVIAMIDFYPKSFFHLLLLNKLDNINSIADIEQKHLPILYKFKKWSQLLIKHSFKLISSSLEDQTQFLKKFCIQKNDLFILGIEKDFFVQNNFSDKEIQNFDFFERTDFEKSEKYYELSKNALIELGTKLLTIENIKKHSTLIENPEKSKESFVFGIKNDNKIIFLEKIEKNSQKIYLKDLNFQIGFHGIPSLNSLHLHIISNDFQSSCLKRFEHWNSFTTDFFVPLEKVISILEKQEKFYYDYDFYCDLLHIPLTCPKCKNKFKFNLEKMKIHYYKCNNKKIKTN